MVRPANEKRRERLERALVVLGVHEPERRVVAPLCPWIEAGGAHPVGSEALVRRLEAGLASSARLPACGPDLSGARRSDDADLRTRRRVIRIVLTLAVGVA